MGVYLPCHVAAFALAGFVGLRWEDMTRIARVVFVITLVTLESIGLTGLLYALN